MADSIPRLVHASPGVRLEGGCGGGFHPVALGPAARADVPLIPALQMGSREHPCTLPWGRGPSFSCQGQASPAALGDWGAGLLLPRALARWAQRG